MTARFAEPCREPPLGLIREEEVVRGRNLGDLSCLECAQDIFLGFFFDGTKNNKYLDTTGFNHSNVARLYEVYPGEPAVKTMALGKPEGFTASPASTPDLEPAWPGAVPAMERKYYRKIYIPGVGRPFLALGDTGNGKDATLGLAMAKHGEVRLNWALLQFTNQIHAALCGSAMADPLGEDAKLARKFNTVEVSEKQFASRMLGELKRLSPTMVLPPTTYGVRHGSSIQPKGNAVV